MKTLEIGRIDFSDSSISATSVNHDIVYKFATSSIFKENKKIYRTYDPRNYFLTEYLQSENFDTNSRWFAKSKFYPRNLAFYSPSHGDEVWRFPLKSKINYDHYSKPYKMLIVAFPGEVINYDDLEKLIPDLIKGFRKQSEYNFHLSKLERKENLELFRIDGHPITGEKISVGFFSALYLEYTLTKVVMPPITPALLRKLPEYLDLVNNLPFVETTTKRQEQNGTIQFSIPKWYVTADDTTVLEAVCNEKYFRDYFYLTNSGNASRNSYYIKSTSIYSSFKRQSSTMFKFNTTTIEDWAKAFVSLKDRFLKKEKNRLHGINIYTPDELNDPEIIRKIPSASLPQLKLNPAMAEMFKGKITGAKYGI